MTTEKDVFSDGKVMIIGSGITGLAAGALLAKQGLQVQVLESNPELLGGQARSFKEAGYWFCAGPQYVWNFNPGDIGWRVLHHLGIYEQTPFDPMNENAFERCYVGDEEPVDVPMGFDRFENVLREKFPAEQEGIEQFFFYIKEFYEGLRPLNDGAVYTESPPRMLGSFVASSDIPLSTKLRTLRFTPFSLKTLFDKFSLSESLRRILYAHGGIFLENESAVSSVGVGAATGFYHAGARYPRYGFRSLIRALSESIQKNGGTVAVNKRVTRLHITDRKITALQCADGEVFRPDTVISNIAPALIDKMIEGASPLQYNVNPSHSVVGLFLGLDNYPGLRDLFNRRNLWWQDGQGEVEYREVDMTRDPRMLYICSPSCNGTENKNDEAGQHSVMVFTPGNYQQDRRAMERGPAEHAALKEKIRNNHLYRLQRHILPDIRKHLNYVRVMTPVDVEQATAAENGGIYGRRGTPGSFLTQPVSNPGVRNLHFACAATGAAGIASGMQTAAVLCEEMTGTPI